MLQLLTHSDDDAVQHCTVSMQSIKTGGNPAKDDCFIQNHHEAIDDIDGNDGDGGGDADGGGYDAVHWEILYLFYP